MFSFLPSTSALIASITAERDSLKDKYNNIYSENVNLKQRLDKATENEDRIYSELVSARRQVGLKDNEIVLLENKLTLLQEFHKEQLDLIEKANDKDIERIENRYEDDIEALKNLQKKILITTESDCNDKIASIKEAFEFKIRKMKEALDIERKAMELESESEFNKARNEGTKYARSDINDQVKEIIRLVKDNNFNVNDLIESLSKLVNKDPVAPAPVTINVSEITK